MFQGGQYMWLHRKGRRRPQWEPLMAIPERISISPCHVLNAYVNLTAAQAPPGSQLFRSL